MEARLEERGSVVGDPAVRLLVVLAAILLTSAVVAELLAVKLFQVPFYAFLGVDTTFTLTGGVLVWPVVFLATDTINEFYGRRAVKLITWVTVGMIALTFLVSVAVIQIPAAEFSPVDDLVFAQVFGQSAWIIAGSMAAFTVSQLVDVAVFHRIRRGLGGRFIWARATGSTIVSQLIDSFVVIYIAFYLPGSVSFDEALGISLSSFGYKLGVAIGLTPLIYVAHWLVELWLGPDRAETLARHAAAGR